MKLKAKFEKYVLEKDFFGDNVLQKYTIECEKIADEFAIEFAEWADENYFKVGNKSIWIEDLDSDIIITSKELLEIFKKEKGW